MTPKFPEKYRVPNPFIDCFLVNGVLVTVADHDDSYHLVFDGFQNEPKSVIESALKSIVEKLFGSSYVFFESRPEGLGGTSQHYDVKRLEA